MNGQQVGRGPVRSWPFEQAYDTYEVGHLLKPGENVIAVLVLHFGISTFYYMRGRGGLLAQLDLLAHDTAAAIVTTDATWRTHRYLAQHPGAPRMVCQQAFAEQIDARLSDEAWITPSFDDRATPRTCAAASAT